MNKRMLCLILIGGLFMLNMAISQAAFPIITSFNDSTTKFNLTSSTIKYFTLPLNASVLNASVAIQGYNKVTNCFQENSTQATTCGALSSGKYGFNNNTGFLYMNYTKPRGASNNSIWQVNWLYDGSFIIRNYTIPKNCWNAFTDKLALYFKSNVSYNSSAEIGCLNSTNRITIQNWSGGSAEGFDYSFANNPRKFNDSIYNSFTSGNCYSTVAFPSGDYETGWLEGCRANANAINASLIEEGVWWIINNYPENITINLLPSNLLQYNYTNNFTTNNKISLNQTQLTNYVSNFVDTNIPLNISFTGGILEVSNLSITYTSKVVIYVYDENNLTLINDNITITIVGQTSGYVNNFNYTGQQLNLTDLPLDTFIITLTGINYHKLDYYYVLGATKNDIVLYAISNTDFNTKYSTLQNYINDKTYYPIEGIISRLYRYYPSTGQWINVQSGLSDTFGQSIHYIIEENTDYRLYFYQGDTLLYQTGSFRLICTSGLCTTKFNIPTSNEQQITVLTTSAFVNASKIFSLNYTEPTGIVTTTELKVKKTTMTGDLVICDDTVASSSGSYSCNIGTTQGTFTYELYANGAQSPVKIGTFSNNRPMLKDILGNNESSFWTFGILLVMAGLGSISPVATVFIMVFGLFFVNLLGISPITNSIVIIIGAIMGYFIGTAVKR